MKNRSSKQALVFLLGFVMICTLCACGGKINNVRVGSVESELYSEKDINDAIRVIVREFDRSWTGCTLTSICYAGDELTGAESEYYLHTRAMYDADELIILLSSFDVDESGGDGSFNPNSTYDGWEWILIRDRGGRWKHVDHGYG